MLIIGKKESIDPAIKVLQGHFQVKDPTSLEDYLGVQIVQVMMARKPGWSNQQLLKVWRNNLEKSCKEENDYYTWNTRVF